MNENQEQPMEDVYLSYQRVARTRDGDIMLKDLFNHIYNNQVRFEDANADKALFQAGQADIMRYIKSHLDNHEGIDD